MNSSYHLQSNGKKGQGISITTIVIAVLALIVLVVLVMIFTGQIGKFGKGIDAQRMSCTDQGGSWQSKGASCAVKLIAFDSAAHPDEDCCKALGPAAK